MKRIAKIQRHELRYCRVYKEELQQVIDLMTVEGKPPKIVSGSYEFSDSDELFKYLGEAGKHEIDISRTQPTISVKSFGSRNTTVDAYDTSDACLGLFHRVVDTLRPCERRAPIRAQGWPAGVTTGLAAWGLSNAAVHIKSWVMVPYLCVGVVCVGLTVWLFKGRGPTDTVFYGVGRSTQKSFWQRKRDDIIMNMGVALVSAALGVGGTLIAQALSK